MHLLAGEERLEVATVESCPRSNSPATLWLEGNRMNPDASPPPPVPPVALIMHPEGDPLMGTSQLVLPVSKPSGD